MPRTLKDKEIRTARFARSTRAAMRRRDMNVRLRGDCREYVDYLGIDRDAAFWKAHKWTPEDVRELVDPYPMYDMSEFYDPFAFDYLDAYDVFDDSYPPVSYDPLWDIDDVLNDAPYWDDPHGFLENPYVDELAPWERELLYGVPTPKPAPPAVKPATPKARVQLPKHLRDPECEERHRLSYAAQRRGC